MAKQRINCMVTKCQHHSHDNACRLNTIQIENCRDQGQDDHESLCASYEESR